MSDTAGGPDWWQGPDGKWYAPQPAPVAGPSSAPSAPLPPGGLAGPYGVPGPYGAPLPYGAPGPYGMPGPYGPYGYPVPRTSGLAIASLVCSLAGMFTLGFGGIPGIILGAIALKRVRIAQGALQGRGLALAGIIIGSIMVGIVILFVLLAIFVHTHNPNSCSVTSTAPGCTG